MIQTLELNEFQQAAMAVPEELDLFLGGGRGGGKSYALALLCLRHAEQYGSDARMLYIRRTYKGLADFELVCRDLFGKVYGTAARYNAAEHVWRFPNGAYLELGQLESHADYAKYQGRSFTMLQVDEAGQFPDPGLLDVLRSNLRGPKGLPIRMTVAANPGGAGHHWLAQRYVFRAAPWSAFNEPKSKREWVYAPSTFAGNHFIDREQYADQLESACPDDPELLKAWTDGDWAVNRGAYFAGCLDENRNAVEPWDEIPEGWDAYLAHDFGSAAPSATYVFAQSPGDEVGGVFYPRNSLVIVDELATYKAGNHNLGLGWTVPVLADAIKAMCKRWSIRPAGVADDACFARTGHGAGSIADEFRQAGVAFHPARKADRMSGWNRMRRLLAAAGDPDRAGLYVARTCTYFWATVPYLPRDPKRIEDMDSTGPDHGADAVRYGCLRQSWHAEVRPLHL
ncbi:phage terminase large subunit [Solilutibacter silvestris]|uniref:Terminase-like family protein n=1 Tax=Solilutibacter silvestris TaxID=1645665 RepID=A0A2K1PYH5_9GAMM|nr:phage terminase large subunit [Lysobacter silvestris]PNS07838.1 Terminase-like family protein [Lysobacter silvestris]